MITIAWTFLVYYSLTALTLREKRLAAPLLRGLGASTKDEEQIAGMCTKGGNLQPTTDKSNRLLYPETNKRKTRISLRPRC